jgi:YggT family protein
VHTEALFALAGAWFVDPLLFTRVTATELIAMVLKIYLFAMLLYWIATFVSPGGYTPGIRLLAQLCEPILRRVRRVIPPIGQIDFSFLWVSIAIGALLILLR